MEREVLTEEEEEAEAEKRGKSRCLTWLSPKSSTLTLEGRSNVKRGRGVCRIDELGFASRLAPKLRRVVR